MNRYAHYGRLDDEPELLGDAGFTRLDMRSDPATLGPGTVQVSQNMRFDQQGASVRGGIQRQLPATITVPTLRWVCVYRPDGSNDRLALITESALYLFNPADQTATTHNYPGGETVASTDEVDAIQLGTTAGSTRYLKILRGLAKAALSFDGAAVTVDADFKRGEFGLGTQGRVIVNTSEHEVSVSDFLAFSIAAGNWNQLQQFRVLKGGADYLVGFLAYQKDYVLVGCRKSFLLAYFAPAVGASGYSGGLVPLDSWVRVLTRATGVVGREAWGEANGLIWAVTDYGIFAFQPQLDNELTQLGDPISKPIQPVMDRLSGNYAYGAQFAVLGPRVYFALPVNGDPVALGTVTVDETPTPNLATANTAAPHNLSTGDTAQITGAVTAELNGVTSTVTVLSATQFTYNTTATSSAVLGMRASVQRIATRNNRIVVFNTALASSASPLGEWESVDTLPGGLFADFLRVADFGAERRLWIIDRVSGPAVFEQGDVDELGSTTGGLLLDFELPATLSEANYEAAPIAGRLKSRTYRWGGFAAQVRAGAARLNVAGGDLGQLSLTVRSPDLTEYAATRDFDGSGNADTEARKRCGKRGLEAELEITTTGGRPVIRTLTVEIARTGRVAEE